MFKQKKKRSREFKSSAKKSDKVIDLEQARAERRAKRKQLANKKQKVGQKAPPAQISERKINKRNRKRLVYFCVIFGIMAVIGVSIFHVYLLQQEYKGIVAENNALKKEKQSIIEELGNVNNPEYIEQQARQQLRMVMPGEVLYVLPPEGTSGPAFTTRSGAELLPAGEASD